MVLFVPNYHYDPDNNKHHSHQAHLVDFFSVSDQTNNIPHYNRRKNEGSQHRVIFRHQQSLSISHNANRYGGTHKNRSFEGFPHGRNMVIRICPPKGKKDCTEQLKQNSLRVHDMQTCIVIQFFCQSQSCPVKTHGAQQNYSGPH